MTVYGEGIAIFGASGYALEVHDAARAAGARVRAFVVDREFFLAERLAEEVPVLVADSDPHTRRRGIVGIGDPSVRRRVAAAASWDWVDVMHPTACVSPFAVFFGRGIYVAQFGVVNHGARIGTHSHVNVGAIVAHRVRVGNFVQIGPQAQLLGDAAVGDGTEVGAGAIVLPKVRIGDGCRIGAGAIVTRDVPPGVVVRGEPSRVRGYV